MWMTTRGHTIGVLFLPLLLLLLIAKPGSTSQFPIAKNGCQDHCGDIPIPYPFGIGLNCSLNSFFNISCDDTTPFLTRLRWSSLVIPYNSTLSQSYQQISPVRILNIDYDSILSVSGSYNAVGVEKVGVDLIPVTTLDMRGSPYVLMATRNVLLVQGCDGSVLLKDADNETVAGCSTFCNPTIDINPKISGYLSCYGIDCCQTSVAISDDFFSAQFHTTVLKGDGHTGVMEAVVVDTSFVVNKTMDEIFNENRVRPLPIPTLLQWRVPDLPVELREYSNSICEQYLFGKQKGYTCRCRYEYHRGNPYLPNGCQVIGECKDCPDTCVTTLAGHNSTTYSCPRLIIDPTKSALPIAVGLGICLGIVLLSIMLYGLYRFLKQRKEIKQKQNNFKRNGGLLLQQQLSSTEGVIERTKIYTSKDLEKATDNFNVNRILGRGGQGTVYKGMLDDGNIAAIKKSEKVSGSSQLKQFINEVVILSEVNHRNVIKLFGCCLETEVPLLVYEFAINGTLSENIHNPNEEFRITWKMRLQIAIQSAEALAYLHSSSYPPIYHRDIKTSNILLDDKYRAKISDFGISKSIGIDQTHVTNTRVQGTFGYIDPEFFRSRQFTDKSDVYSFGIVLVELMTSKKAVYEDNSLDTISLASNILDLKQNNRLYDIVDAQVLDEAKKEELEGVADLAEQCLHLSGRQRPTMREVVTTLLMITSQHRAQIPSANYQVSDDKNYMVNEFSSSNSITYYASSEDDPPHIQEQPLYSSTFSSDTHLSM